MTNKKEAKKRGKYENFKQEFPIEKAPEILNPGIKGLRNVGNTCFMNSTIQCLSNIPCFRDYFRQHCDEFSIDQDTIRKSLSELLNEIWSTRNSIANPSNLISAISIYKEKYGELNQQDSHEFLIHLLEILHDELNQKATNSNVDFSEIYFNSKNFDKYIPKRGQKLWSDYLQFNSTLISHLFHSLLLQKIRCFKCDYVSLKFEVLNGITLPIPSTHRTDKKKLKSLASLDLDYCLNEYLKPIISDDAEYFCKQCNRKTQSQEKIHFFNLPKILIIQLNRFKYDYFGNKLKDNQMINFKTELNLKEHVMDKKCYSEYELIGISNHVGNLEFGHYTTYAKNGNTGIWYEFNDSSVKPIDNLKISTHKAYYLVYSQREVNLNAESVYKRLDEKKSSKRNPFSLIFTPIFLFFSPMLISRLWPFT